MKEVTVGANDAGQRADRFLQKVFPLIPFSMMNKAFRLKRIKRNGKRIYPEDKLIKGDILGIYLNDEYLAAPHAETAYLRAEPTVKVVYEDENILLCDKEPGVTVHEDARGAEQTLIAKIQAYLHTRGEWDPEREMSFTPALCNRIDRNTGGIVICAKNAEALRIINEKIRRREIEKRYLCAVHGEPSPSSGTPINILVKDDTQNRVTVYPAGSRIPGGLTAITRYQTAAVSGGMALLECALETGRTHQIRAQLAAVGHPLVGDGKYGENAEARKIGIKHQLLYSYYIRFAFNSNAGVLDYLNNRTFRVATVPFMEKLFPSLCIDNFPDECYDSHK